MKTPQPDAAASGWGVFIGDYMLVFPPLHLRQQGTPLVEAALAVARLLPFAAYPNLFTI